MLKAAVEAVFEGGGWCIVGITEFLCNTRHLAAFSEACKEESLTRSACACVLRITHARFSPHTHAERMSPNCSSSHTHAPHHTNMRSV